MNTTLRSFAAGLLLGLPVIATATPVAFHPLLEHLPVCTESARSRSAVDLDGDGRKELVVGCGSPSERPTVNVFGIDASGRLVRKHAWMLPYDDAQWPLLTWSDASGGHIGIVRGGRLERWSGWPPRNEGFVSFAGAGPYIDAQSTVIADVDGDGIAELPYQTGSPSRIDLYAVPGGEVRSSIPLAPPPLHFTGSKMDILQLDMDPALEIVLRDHDGYVTIADGATHAVAYHHGPLLSPPYVVVAGRLLPDGGAFLNPSGDSRWSLYRAAPWQELWNNRPMSNVGSPRPGDVDGDGIEEVVFLGLDGSIPSIMGMKILEATPRRMADLDPSAPWTMVLADIDDDGRSEIVLSSVVPEGKCIVSAWNGVTATERYRLEQECRSQLAGPFIPDATGAATDMVVHRRYGEDFLRRVNALTGDVVWTAPAPIPEVRGNVWALALFDAGQGQAEIITSAAGEDFGWFSFHDAVTGAHKRTFQVGGPGAWGAPREFAVRTNAQGVPVGLVACMSNGRVREFRYDTGEHVWTMPGADFGCTNVWIDDASIVVTGTSDVRLAAYDIDTRQLRWQATADTWRVFPLALDGEPTRYLLVNDDHVDVFDPAAQQIVRSFPLPFPADHGIRDIVVPPGGDVHHLIVRTRRGVAVIDGMTGELRARVDHLAQQDPRRGALSVGSTDADGRYLVGVVGENAWWTFALDLPPDRIFAGGFDP